MIFIVAFGDDDTSFIVEAGDPEEAKERFIADRTRDGCLANMEDDTPDGEKVSDLVFVQAVDLSTGVAVIEFDDE